MRLLAIAISLLLCAPSAAAVRLKPTSLETFQRYVRLTDARVQKEVASVDGFLWMDFLAAHEKQSAYARLKKGEIVIEALETTDSGKRIEDSDSLIHHWVGVVFIPGAKLPATMAIIQDYDHHAEIFKPDVVRSKILAHEGNRFKTHVRFLKKKVLTVVNDTEHEVHYFPLDAARIHSRTWTTRVQQVENHGEKDEKILPPGDDDGYLWQLNTWWRFQDKNGGVYVQCEAVTLTRDIPTGLGWLIGPFVKGVPRESIQFTLETTRKAVLARRP